MFVVQCTFSDLVMLFNHSFDSPAVLLSYVY